MGYALSPDASRLFIVDGRMGPYKPFYLGTAQGGPVTVLHEPVNAAPFATWGSDGWVYFQSAFDGFWPPRIYRIHPDTGALEFVTRGSAPLWESRGLFFLRREHLFCRNAQGSELQLSGLAVQGFALQGETVFAGFGGDRGALYSGRLSALPDSF